MSYRIPLVILGTALLGGCFNVNTSQVPQPITYPYTEQQKMQAAYHWQVLAEHEAQQILDNARLDGRALFIAGGMQHTPFAQGFDALLTSQLVSQGAIVRTDPINTAQVDTRVQVVTHKDRGYIRAPRGAWTTLAGGVAVATLPLNNWSEPALALIPAAAAVDLFSGSWTSLSNTEIVVTTQVTDNNRILYSSSNIYYINAGDEDHYSNEAILSTPIPLTNRW